MDHFGGVSVKAFKCDKCGRGFHDQNALAQHLSVQHGIGEAKQFACPDCPRWFRSAQGVLDHRFAIHARLAVRKAIPAIPSER